MKPFIRKLSASGDYDLYMITYKDDCLVQRFTEKWGDKIDTIYRKAINMKVLPTVEQP